ncbi:hypothetical protein KQX54_021579 [Cotesia glomerata]|uniref:Uncharacterized protein n=1 Tax=Cotesia glomerata TaxID=32391 RepID=A0AAV7J9V1_COTGL|nr:hypothetical protein KQX54_021579 [Cotesia glomerata]
MEGASFAFARRRTTLTQTALSVECLLGMRDTCATDLGGCFANSPTIESGTLLLAEVSLVGFSKWKYRGVVRRSDRLFSIGHEFSRI